MKYFTPFLFSGFLLIGCTSAHNIFVSNMNTTVADYSDFKKNRNTTAYLNDSTIVKITKDAKGNIVYHHKTNQNGKRKNYCEYYIVVEPKSQTIIDWGFENKETAKYCAIYT